MIGSVAVGVGYGQIVPSGWAKINSEREPRGKPLN